MVDFAAQRRSYPAALLPSCVTAREKLAIVSTSSADLHSIHPAIASECSHIVSMFSGVTGEDPPKKKRGRPPGSKTQRRPAPEGMLCTAQAAQCGVMALLERASTIFQACRPSHNTKHELSPLPPCTDAARLRSLTRCPHGFTAASEPAHEHSHRSQSPGPLTAMWCRCGGASGTERRAGCSSGQAAC